MLLLYPFCDCILTYRVSNKLPTGKSRSLRVTVQTPSKMLFS